MKKGELLSIAIKIAVDAHFGQFDRGGNPYILHPLHVMDELAKDKEDEEVQAIGVLHDAVEDNKNITYHYLKELGIPDRVVAGVRCVTKVPGETAEEYQERVISNPDAIKVKKKDLAHNSDLTRLKGITDKDIARNAAYMKFYYRLTTLNANPRTSAT